MLRSDFVFSQRAAYCSKASRRRGCLHRYRRRADGTNDVVGHTDVADDDDDDSLELDDLILGNGSKGNSSKAAAGDNGRETCRDDGDDHANADEDSSIESSLEEEDGHADYDDAEDDTAEGDDANGIVRGSPLSLSARKGAVLEGLDVPKSSRSKLGQQGYRDSKMLTDSHHSYSCYLNDETNEFGDRDGISVFDLSSSCLSYDYEEAVKDDSHDPQEAQNDAPGQKQNGMPSAVRFSAGKNLHRHQAARVERTSSTSAGGARTALQITPMSRITEHTREWDYASSDIEDVSTGGKANSAYRGGCGRSSVTTSGNNSFAEDASSKMSTRSKRFETFSPSPKCSTGGGTWVTMERCDILNIQDLQSLMLSMDE